MSDSVLWDEAKEMLLPVFRFCVDVEGSEQPVLPTAAIATPNGDERSIVVLLRRLSKGSDFTMHQRALPDLIEVSSDEWVV